MAILRFQDGGRRHLGFAKKFKSLTVRTVKTFEMHHLAKFRQYWLNGRDGHEVQMHNLAKFRQYRLNRGRDMAIFRFFKMAAAAILDF